MARVYVKVQAGEIRKAVRETGIKKLISLTKNPAVLKRIGEKAIELVTPYVPADSEALQKSAHVIYHEKQVQLVWGSKLKGANGNATEDYAHYQYEGEVYGPNIPIRVDGIIVGWRSSKGKGSKYATGQNINYTSSNAIPHWTEVITRGGSEFGKLTDFAASVMVEEMKRGNK